MAARPSTSIPLLLLVAALLVVFVVSALAGANGGASAALAPVGAEEAAGPPATTAVPPATPAVPPRVTPEMERARIASHLAAVEADLRAASVDDLTAAQRTNRVRHLDVLREYRERGAFPRNLDFPGRAVPYFVDDRGVHCAVGYLIHRDGRDDIVERIASERNNATIAELADDAELLAWLAEAGLTPDEAARIQPMYCQIGEPCCGMFACPPDQTRERTVSSRYATASFAAGALAGFGAGLQLAGGPASESRWVAALGTASGLAGVGLGVHGLANGRDTRTVGAVNLALGLLGTAVGVRSLTRAPSASLPRPGYEEEDEDRSSVTLAPLLTLPGEAGAQVGVAVRIRR